ncbi:uncharacterized protein I206_101072 [Kwoniella pini CBS 10737]|uniref:Uncharacterized protein n=1 Tax=Kwoniella pini CBS 10737 TaxID=1296096 RepID=A0A1B9IBY6_9TREE|nr:uncharacterized protein I206_00254 [Kwoniella pini CBS 10737]OCF52953.1 hypothetical protein I206_00254 [Kwoniella pini CBS 10737]
MAQQPKRPFWVVESMGSSEIQGNSESNFTSQLKSDVQDDSVKGYKRRRIENDAFNNVTPVMKSSLPPRPQSVPLNSNPSTNTPHRMITRSSTKSTIPLSNERAQIASPSETIIPNSLQRVAPTSSNLNSSSLNTSSIVNSTNDYGKVFSYPGYPPFTPIRTTSSHQFTNYQTNHKNDDSIESIGIIAILRNQLENSNLTIRKLESRIINTESILFSKSTELDNIRMENQSLKFQLNQISNQNIPKQIVFDDQVQLDNQKKEYENKLNLFKQQLDKIVENVRIDKENIQKESKETNERLKIDLTEKDKKIKEAEIIIKELKGKGDIDIKSREVLKRLSEARQKVIENLQNDLKAEKNRGEEIRRVGWEQLNSLRKEQEVFQERFKVLENENSSLRKTNDNMRTTERIRHDELLRERRELEKERTNLVKDEKTKSAERTKIEQLEKDLSMIKSSHQRTLDEKDGLAREVKQNSRKCQELNEQYNLISESADFHRNENEQLRGCLDVERKFNGGLNAEIKELKRQNTNLDNQVKQLKDYYSKLKTRSASSQDQSTLINEKNPIDDLLEKDRLKLWSKIARLKNHLRNIEEKLSKEGKCLSQLPEKRVLEIKSLTENIAKSEDKLRESLRRI